MQIIFSDESFPEQTKKSIFLEGPSPRSGEIFDWRHDAIKILAELLYDGIVYIPIPRGIFYGTSRADISYDNQIPYEIRGRQIADVIICWVARVIDRSREDLGMPGFTTNFEFAEDLPTHKVVYGRPDDAVKCKYLDMKAEEHGLDIHSELADVVSTAVKMIGEGALRTLGEVSIPLLIWRTEQFQSWYQALRGAGHSLTFATVKNVMNGPAGLFSYLLKVTVWIPSEGRFKENEFVFARPDISAVVAYHVREDGTLGKIALVREFRSSVNNRDGYVIELASGSSDEPGQHPRTIAVHEVHEELGLIDVTEDRLEFIGARQLVATVSSHRSHVYMLELSDNELIQLERASDARTVFGVLNDSEKTYVSVVPIEQIFDWQLDYSMLGMIAEVRSTVDARALGSANKLP